MQMVSLKMSVLQHPQMELVTLKMRLLQQLSSDNQLLTPNHPSNISRRPTADCQLRILPVFETKESWWMTTMNHCLRILQWKNLRAQAIHQEHRGMCLDVISSSIEFKSLTAGTHQLIWHLHGRQNGGHTDNLLSFWVLQR
jgi:hypothetical protein